VSLRITVQILPAHKGELLEMFLPLYYFLFFYWHDKNTRLSYCGQVALNRKIIRTTELPLVATIFWMLCPFVNNDSDVKYQYQYFNWKFSVQCHCRRSFMAWAYCCNLEQFARTFIGNICIPLLLFFCIKIMFSHANKIAQKILHPSDKKRLLPTTISKGLIPCSVSPPACASGHQGPNPLLCLTSSLC